VSLLEEPAARQAFLRTLSARRGAGQHLSCASFLRLARALWWLLDVCASQDDARGAAAVLILSETYYRRAHAPEGPQGQGKQGQGKQGQAEGDRGDEADGVAEEAAAQAGASEDVKEGEDGEERSALIPEAEREYVQRYLRRHPLWRSDAFWQESLYRAVRDEVAKLIDPTVASNTRLSSIFAATETADAAAVAGGAEGGAAAAAGSPSPGSSGSGGSPRPAGAASARPGLGIGPASPDARFAGVTGSISDPSVFSGNEGDAQYAYAQVLFGQLMALSVNMTSFGEAGRRGARSTAVWAVVWQGWGGGGVGSVRIAFCGRQFALCQTRRGCFSVSALSRQIFPPQARVLLCGLSSVACDAELLLPWQIPLAHPCDSGPCATFALLVTAPLDFALHCVLLLQTCLETRCRPPSCGWRWATACPGRC
jgi:hypothetical protein